jgi:hypothetical protein
MTFSELKLLTQFPKELSPLVGAMCHDYQGNWEASHNLAQDVHTPDGSWVHAYLHRKEGDISNARYWYHQAGKQMPAISLEKEWEEIVKALLEKEVS